MSIDWGPVVIVALLMGAIFTGIWIASRIDKRRQRVAAAMRREQNLYAPYITQALVDEAEYIVRDQDQAMRIANSWPCSHEDGWCTGECFACGYISPGGIYRCTLSEGHPGVHANHNRAGTVTWSEPPRGRHHVIHTITDLPEPSDPRWRQ